jgi:hypothetical protein
VHLTYSYIISSKFHLLHGVAMFGLYFLPAGRRLTGQHDDDLRELCRQMTRISCVLLHEKFATIRTQSEIKQKKEDFQSNENIGTLQGLIFQK